MKIASVLLVSLVMAGCAGSPASPGGKSAGTSAGSPPAPRLDPGIVAMVAQVSPANLTGSMVKLSSFNTRHTCSDDSAGSNAIGGARDWIKAQLLAIPGLTVRLDPFTSNRCGAVPDGGALPTVTRDNVVAWKLGSGHPDRLIVVGGHYDSRTLDGRDVTSPAPGANDSGSQTSLVIEAARVMASQTFDATLVFVAFAGEEQGLLGSRSLAQGYTKYFSPAAKIEAMLNCDIVGGDSAVNDAATLQQFRLYSPGTPREIRGGEGTPDDTSPARGLMRHIATWSGAYVPSMTIVPMLREDRPHRGSDHMPFLELGSPGVRFIEAVESPDAGAPESHQHSPNDLMAYVTPAYTARMTQVVVADAAALARAPGPPQSITATGSAAGPITVGWTAPAAGAAVDHYVLAGRASTENFYHARVTVPAGATSGAVTAADLGIGGASTMGAPAPKPPTLFVSVAAVDAQGHESLFAYPEYRCDAAGCAVQPGSLDVTVKN